MDKEDKPYLWTKNCNMVVLTEGRLRDVCYNKITLQETIKNIKQRRKDFATKKAWIARLKMYQEGMELLCG